MDNLDYGNLPRRHVRGVANVALADRLFEVRMGGGNGCGGHAQHRGDREDHGNYAERPGRALG